MWPPNVTDLPPRSDRSESCTQTLRPLSVEPSGLVIRSGSTLAVMSAQQWEYLLHELVHDTNQVDAATWLAELNRLGAEGWEAVGPVNILASPASDLVPELLLKRPVY